MRRESRACSCQQRGFVGRLPHIAFTLVSGAIGCWLEPSKTTLTHVILLVGRGSEMVCLSPRTSCVRMSPSLSPRHFAHLVVHYDRYSNPQFFYQEWYRLELERQVGFSSYLLFMSARHPSYLGIIVVFPGRRSNILPRRSFLRVAMRRTA